MNYMTASIILDVNLTKVSSDLKKAEAEAKRAAKEVDRQAQRTMKAVEKAHKDMAKEADKAAKAAAKAHALAVKKIKKAYASMTQSIKNALSIVAKGAAIGLAVLTAALGFSTKAAMKQEDAVFLLNAALKISGEYTKELETDFRNFAAEIQKATVYGDEFVLSLMQQQRSLGVTADRLKDGAKMAIGLATATGQGIESMSRYVALAYQGEFTMLRRYIPALRATTDATEQLAIVTKFASDGFKLAKERSQTTSGSLKQLWNTIGDVAEKIGIAFLPMIRRASDTIKEWAENNQKRIGEMAKVWAKKLEFVTGKVWDFIKLLTTDWKTGIKYGLAAGIILIEGFAKTVFTIFSDLFVGIGANMGIFIKRGIAQGLEVARLEKEFLSTFEFSGGQTKEAEAYRRKRAREYAEEKLATGYFKPVLAEAYPYIDVMSLSITDLGRIADETKQKLKDLAETYKKDVSPEVVPTTSDAPVWFDPMAELDFSHIEEQSTRSKEAEDNMVAAHLEGIEARKELDTEHKTHWQYFWDDLSRIAKDTTNQITEYVARLASQAQQYLSDALYDSLTKAESWKDSMKALWQDVLKSFIRMCTDMVAQAVMFATIKAALGLGGAVFGAPVGAGGQPFSPNNPYGLALNPPGAADGGYVDRSGLAVIHKGETVTPAGGGNVTVNVNNQAGVQVDVDNYMQSDQRIIDVTLRAAAGNGTYRRGHRLGR